MQETEWDRARVSFSRQFLAQSACSDFFSSSFPPKDFLPDTFQPHPHIHQKVVAPASRCRSLLFHQLRLPLRYRKVSRRLARILILPFVPRILFLHIRSIHFSSSQTIPIFQHFPQQQIIITPNQLAALNPLLKVCSNLYCRPQVLQP